MFALEYEEEIWRQDAACTRLGVPAGIFFSEDLGDIARAKGICTECPVLAPCLEAAVEEQLLHFLSPNGAGSGTNSGRPPRSRTAWADAHVAAT